MKIEIKDVEQHTLEVLIAEHQHRKGALLPLLHAVQEALGHVPAAAVALIAKGLNLSRAEVHGVITYYHFFRTHAPGQHVVQVCRAEACQACGGEDLLAHIEELLGCKVNHTRGDGGVTLESVYCLGLCASSPAIQIDERLHARMSKAKVEPLLKKLAQPA